MTWTLETAQQYIKSARTRGLKYISACDYLKHNHGIDIMKDNESKVKKKREVKPQPKRKVQEGERRSILPQHTLKGKFDIVKEGNEK